jgi:DNA-binding transcriptional LysR family regulator
MEADSAASGVELRHFRAFLAVAQYKSFTQAAASLWMSQSALSRTIAGLERLTGQRLIERHRQALHLSEAGEYFLPYAHRAVAAADEAFSAIRAEGFPLRIGFTWNALGEDTGPLIKSFESEYPGVTVQLQRCDDSPLAGLSDGRSHLAILRGIPEGEIGYLHFREEQRVVVLPSSHRLAGREVVALEEISDDPLVVNVISGSGTTHLWKDGRDDPPRRVLEVNNIDEWLEAIAVGRGIGVSTTTTALFHAYPGVVYLPLHDTDPVSVVIAWMNLNSHPHTAHFVAAAKRWRSVGSP